MDKIHPVTAHQFREIFENVYHGKGVDGKPWLSVLGNHDYGGFQFLGSPVVPLTPLFLGLSGPGVGRFRSPPTPLKTKKGALFF